MNVLIHPHALQRLLERGATEEEARETVESGEKFPAKLGRTGFRRNFGYNRVWRSNHYQTKQIEAIAVEEDGGWIVITVMVKFF